MIRARLILGLLAIFVLAATVNAATTGKISGKVIDAETGDPLIGANVVIEGTDLGASTDQDGYYHIINIPVGTYSVRAGYIGYQSVRKTEVEVLIGLTSTVNFELKATAIESGEVVEVVAERPIVRKDVTSGRSIISSDEISKMPVETVSGVLSTKAGVTEGANGAIHIRGGRSSEVSYVIDGVRVNDPAYGGQAVNVENQAIQELEVVSGTFNAEYGQALSGVVNIVTKEGSRKYSGSVSAYLGDYVTGHSDIFWNDKNFNPTNSHNLAMTLSGPLLPFDGLRNKLNFFVSYRDYSDDGYIYGIRAHNPNDVMFLESSTVQELLSTDFADQLNVEEPFTDLNQNGQWDGGEPYIDTNQNGEYNPGVDQFFDLNGNGQLDGEYYLDFNQDSLWNDGFSGDSSLVPMAPNSRQSTQAKLTWKVLPNVTMRYSYFLTNGKSKNYTHNFRYNPDGDLWTHTNNQLHILGLSHSLSKDMNYTLNYSYAKNSTKDYVYANPLNSQYLPNILLQRPSTYEFYSGGMNSSHTVRDNTIQSLKFDMTWQANKIHQFKTGFELRDTKMKYESFSTIINSRYDWQPTIENPDESTNNDQYWNTPRNPKEYSYYIQDKIELEDMVVNAGIRFDYFDPNFIVPTDLSSNKLMIDNRTSLADLSTKKTTPKMQWSPRLGIAFPITDRGIIHFSYGHFFQIPSYAYLYANPEFEIIRGPFNSILGNANLNPQRTVIYEVGLQQQLSASIGMEIIGYFKDIQDLLSSSIYELHAKGNKYTRYSNQDYGNVKGVTFSLEKRATQNLSASIDYTYQIAEGNASDPLAVYYDNQTQPPQESEKKTVPLDWDQTHTLNLVVSYDVPNSWGMSILGNYGSGLPYTPQYQGYRLDQENSARKPDQYKLDIYLYKVVPVGGLDFMLYARIYNLFDRLNQRYVYDDTGSADYSLVPTYVPNEGGQYGRHDLSNYLSRPNYYAPPRQIRLGLKVSF